MGQNDSTVGQKAWVANGLRQTTGRNIETDRRRFTGVATSMVRCGDQDFCESVKVRKDAKKLLNDDNLVDRMMPWLVCNLDEECVHALGKNSRIVGSYGRKKHDNQNASSRSFLFVLGINIPAWHPEGDAHSSHPLGD